MRSVTVRTADLKNIIINLGFVGENEHRQIRFDAKKDFEEYPHASASLTVVPPEGESYPAIIERDGDYVLWTITDSDVIGEGDGEIQLAFTEGEVVKRTCIARTKTDRSLVPTGSIPSGIDDFITRAGAALTAIPETINAALAEAKASGEFDGPPGEPGQDGYSPTATVSKSGSVATITITDKNGTTTAQISDGEGGGTGDYEELDNLPQIGGVTLKGNKTLHDLGAAAESDIPDPTSIIDDTAGSGDTNKVWSADKSHELLTEINSKYEKPAGGIPGTDLANSYIKEPSSEGTSGQVLATNGSGGRIWTTPTGSGVVLDATLSVPGAAADAAATGKVRSKITSDFEYVVGEYNLLDNATYTDGYYIDSAGNIGASSGWAYSSLIPVTDAVYRLMWEKVTTGSYTIRVHGYDANGDWVKQLAYAQKSTAQIYNLDFDCTGVKSIRISISKNYTKPICLSLKKTVIEMANEADGNYNKVLDDYPFSVKTIKIEDKFLDKYDGEFTAQEGFKAIITNPIRCKGGDVFSYKGRGVYSVASAVFYSKGAYVTYAVHDSETAYVDITVPSTGNIDEVIFQSGKNGSWDFAFDVQKKEQDKRLGFFEKLEIPTVNALTGKKWTVCGDSFTYGDFTGLQTSEYILQDGLYKGKNKVYPYIIGNRTHCIVNNVAVGGMSLAKTSSNNFVDQYQTLIDTTSDYLTLWFGINDKNGNVPVGELMDGNNLNTDPTTFYGAWNIVLSYIRTNMPYAHVGIVITNGMDKNAQAPYTAATRAVAKYHGYPFLDLQLDTSLPMFLWCEERPDVGDSVRSAINSTFKVSNSNNHPNPNAHEFQSYFIEKWLLGL